MSLLELKDLSYSYDIKTPVLDKLNYSFEKGSIYAIMGRSGAGKTTLLSLLSGLTDPTSGTILYDGKNIRTIDKYHFRSRCVGVVFQGFNLLPQLTAVENVELSMDISGSAPKNKREKAMELLEKVDLDEVRAKRRVLKLSGGEQQRVAIARALSYEPDIILADEPTGNLDLETQEEVMDIFRYLAHEENKCVIIVTHSPEVAQSADVLYKLEALKKPTKKKRVSKVIKQEEDNELISRDSTLY